MSKLLFFDISLHTPIDSISKSNFLLAINLDAAFCSAVPRIYREMRWDTKRWEKSGEEEEEEMRREVDISIWDAIIGRNRIIIILLYHYIIILLWNYKKYYIILYYCYLQWFGVVLGSYYFGLRSYNGNIFICLRLQFAHVQLCFDCIAKGFIISLE